MHLAVCLIVKDEARDIAEWIAYHVVAGVETFLVYDNGSSDGTNAVLAAAASLHDVRVTPWRTRSHQAQMDAYRHAIRTTAGQFDWLALIDSDEYVVVHRPDTLASLCRTDASAIAINWAIFGSSGHAEPPPGLMIEGFTRRAETAFPINRHVKSLVRPAAVAECLNPHAFAVRGKVVLADGRPLRWMQDGGLLNVGLTQTAPDHTVAQINHYFTRSRAHWARKVARGYPNPGSTVKLGQFTDYDRNEVEDTSALRALPDVRRLRDAILDRALADPRVPLATAQTWRALREASVPA